MWCHSILTILALSTTAFAQSSILKPDQSFSNGSIIPNNDVSFVCRSKPQVPLGNCMGALLELPPDVTRSVFFGGRTGTIYRLPRREIFEACELTVNIISDAAQDISAWNAISGAAVQVLLACMNRNMMTAGTTWVGEQRRIQIDIGGRTGANSEYGNTNATMLS